MTAQHDPITEIDRASHLIDDVQKRTGGVASRKQLAGIQRRTSRLLYATVAICLLFSIVAISATAFMVPRLARTEANTAVNTAAIESAIQVREQLRSTGVAEQDLPPVPEPRPPEEGVDIDSIVDSVAAIVLNEIRTDPRYRGPAGNTGDPGQPCDPAVWPACIGPEGASGDPGDDGEQGPKGEQGDPCLPENPACRGPAGDDAPRITDAGPVLNDQDVCVFRTTLEDGTIFDKPTREENCPMPDLFPDEN